MSWKNNIRNALMGATYQEHPVVAPLKVTTPMVSVPLDAPEPAMAMEENIISSLRRAEFLSDTPVLSRQDPILRTAGFRDRSALTAKPAQPDSRAWLQMQADAPVAPRPAQLVTSSEVDRAEKPAQRRSYQGFMPVMRKVAE